MSRVLGVLGGKDTPPEAVRGWALGADWVVAADSGADACLAVGIRPSVVGDMDSFKGDATGLDMRPVPDQDTTDCDKLLAWVAERGHRAVTIACLEGDRIDHVLASLASLARSPLVVSVVSRRSVGRVVRAGERVAFAAPEGTRFSVLGLGECIAGVGGARWPFESSDLTPPRPPSISNRVKGDAWVEVERGCALLTVELAVEPWRFPWPDPCADSHGLG